MTNLKSRKSILSLALSIALLFVGNSVFAANPTVTIDQEASQTDPTNSSPVLFTVIFNEPVTGFDSDADLDFSASTTPGTLTSVIIESGPLDGTTYLVSISGMTGSGDVIISVNAGAATAIAAPNDPNLASTSTDNTVLFGATPSVTVNQASGQADPTASTTIDFTAVFSESVSGFIDDSNITFGGTAPGTLTATVTEVAPMNGTTYDIEVTGMSDEGTVTVALQAGSGNATGGTNEGSAASTSTDNQVYFDDTNPTVASFTPGDDATDVSLSLDELILNFDEDVVITPTAVSTNAHRIRIREGGTNLLSIDKDNAAVSIASNIVTIDLALLGFNFSSSTTYNIRIGNDTFEDESGNNYAGISDNTTWNFTTVSLGVSGPNQNVCIGTGYVDLGDITVSEASNGDFSSGNNQSFILSMPSGFELEPGVGAVNVSGADISNESIAINSSNIILFYTIDGSANNPSDQIVITGLKVRATGSPSSGDILRTGGDADQNGNNVVDAKPHGSLTSANGTISFSNDATGDTICDGEAITFTASATGATSYSLFIDGALNQTNSTGNFNSISSLIDGQEVSVLATGGSCEETASVAITVTDVPVVDAGGPQTICFGEEVLLGGTPTLMQGTGATPYTYSWAGPGMTPAESVNANPTVTPPDPGAADDTYNYTVTVTDANGCASASDNVNVLVRSTDEAVEITSPPQFNFADTDDPVALEGTPGGGIFAGTGVTQLGDGTYQFSPASAGRDNSPHTISYTATISNGCKKTISELFIVSEGGNVIENLPVNNNFCSNETPTGVLSLTADYQDILDNAEYSLVEFTLSPSGNGITGTSGISRLRLPGGFIVRNHTPPNQRFDPQQSGPGTFTVSSVIHNDYSADGINSNWVGQNIRVNEVPNVFFSNINSGQTNPNAFCRVNQDYVLTGNQSGGVWEIGLTGDPGSFQTANAGGVNGLSSSDGTQAVFNPSGVSQNGNWTIRYSYDPGTFGSTSQPCTGTFSQDFVVNGLPSVSFNEGASEVDEGEEFCYDSPAELIIGNPATGDVQYSGYGVSYNAGTNQAVFSPATAIDQYEFDNNVIVTSPQTFQLTFTFRNSSTECFNSVVRNVTVHPRPQATFTFDHNDLCYNSSPELLDAQQPQGRFYLTYPNASIEIVANNSDYIFDPAALFDEAVTRGHNPLDQANFKVEWRVSQTIDGGSKTCTNSQIETFIVTPLESVSMAGISNNDKYCSNNEDLEIELAPLGGRLFLNSNEIVSSVTIPFNFSPSNRGAGNYTLRYEVTTGNGCTSAIEKIIEVLASPEASFPTVKYCEGDVIAFDAVNDPVAVEYEWDFGDNSPIVMGQNVTHQYETTGSFTAELTLRAAEVDGIVCESKSEEIVDIGKYPNTGFTFSNVCEGESTLFAPASDISIETYFWDYGDTQNSTSIASTTHDYAAVGNYNVKLVASTTNDCTDTVQQRVSILPTSTNNPASPYVMAEIDGGQGGWADRNGRDSLTSVWEFGVPQGTVINGADPAWVTNLDGSYNANDQAYVLSPCFDLSAFQRPVLSMDFWSDTQRESDGVVFQYSIDGGVSWQTLGSVQNGVSTGLNWYNQAGITGSPGGQQLYGWSRAGDTEWTIARHALDAIPQPRDNVRFRVAFGANGDTQLEGFAFRNVKIEERNKVVLLEHFTNVGTSTGADTYVRAFGSSSNEVVKLEYRTSFPVDDPLNLENEADNNSRASYYGITSSPRTLLDGEGESTLITSGWGETLFSQKTLTTSPFNISVASSVADDKLVIDVNIEAMSNTEDDNTVVHIVLAEKDESGSDFIYSMKRMVPTAAGTKLKNGDVIDITETFNVNQTVQITEAFNPSEMALITFIQNEDTGEVYQTDINEGITLPPVVTGTGDNINEGLTLYPNPAHEKILITFNSQIDKDNALKIYDSFGKLVYTKNLNKNHTLLEIDTRDFAAGLYHVQVKTKDGAPFKKRLMIVHK